MSKKDMKICPRCGKLDIIVGYYCQDCVNQISEMFGDYGK